MAVGRGIGAAQHLFLERQHRGQVDLEQGHTSRPRQAKRAGVESCRDENDLAASAHAGIHQKVIEKPCADNGCVHNTGHRITDGGYAFAGQSAHRRGHERLRVRVVEKPIRSVAFIGSNTCHA